MSEHELTETSREMLDEEMVTQAFQHLLDTYLASRHRKKVEIITKAFNFAKQAPFGRTLYHASHRRGANRL